MQTRIRVAPAHAHQVVPGLLRGRRQRRIQLGDETFHARKGACINIPPGVPHKVGSTAGMRMLMVYSPPGLEGMMKAMKSLSPEQLADGALTSKILAEYDTIVLGEATGSKGYGSVLG
jgi:AraC-like protein